MERRYDEGNTKTANIKMNGRNNRKREKQKGKQVYGLSTFGYGQRNLVEESGCVIQGNNRE